jgi:hypothetical protein
MTITARRAAASIFALVAAWSTGASAADHPFSARFDWRSEGEIKQVWFHREFHGRLLQTAPITLDAGPALQTLLAGISIECTADTSIGLPNWSVTTGLCTLSRENGAVTIEVIECAGTQKLCEGSWRIVSGTGDFARLSGSGTVEGHLVEPDPLPWLWNGPTSGFNILTGFISIP